MYCKIHLSYMVSGIKVLFSKAYEVTASKEAHFAFSLVTGAHVAEALDSIGHF